MSRWQILKPELDTLFGPLRVYTPNGKEEFSNLIRRLIERGERCFAAASGDGGMNLLINSIVRYRGVIPLREFVIGGVGLGSSNDYYKPVTRKIFNMPVRLDTKSARLRDVGEVEYLDEQNCIHTTYFLTSASIGIVAEGNALFNRRSRISDLLGKISFNLVVLWIFLRTLLRFEGLPLCIAFDSGEIINMKTTCLCISKTPYISGNFRFNENVSRNGGIFLIKIIPECGRMNTIRTLFHLGRGAENRIGTIITRFAGEVKIGSPASFTLEIDGETLVACSARFRIYEEGIRECG